MLTGIVYLVCEKACQNTKVLSWVLKFRQWGDFADWQAANSNSLSKVFKSHLGNCIASHIFRQFYNRLMLLPTDQNKTYMNSSRQGLVHVHPGTDGLQGTWTGVQLQRKRSLHFLHLLSKLNRI